MIKQFLSLLLANLLNDRKRRQRVLAEICSGIYLRTGIRCSIGRMKFGLTGRIECIDIKLFFQGLCYACDRLIVEIGYFSLLRRVIEVRYVQLERGSSRANLSLSGEQSRCQLRLSSRSPISIELSVTNIDIESQMLSARKFFVPDLSLFAEIRSDNGAYTLSDQSRLSFCSIPAEISFQFIPATGRLEAGLDVPRFTPDQILTAFPDFICRELYSLDAIGDISLKAHLGCFLNDPDRFSFDISFKQNGLALQNAEQSTFSSLRNSLRHKISGAGPDGSTGEIEISEHSPGFTKLRHLPETFIHIIVATEDPNFFSHPGVDWKFMGYALFANIRKGKIAKGGSTITMQTVRNLYLGHQQNIYRKLEEMIISWLLEGIIRLPKRRVLEIYLNIIEFAPGVYGIKNASEYYFSKPPSGLTLTECIVLSYIIPRPKFFQDAWWSSSGQLITNLRKHIKQVSETLVKRGFINYAQFDTVSYNISIMNKTLSLI